MRLHYLFNIRELFHVSRLPFHVSRVHSRLPIHDYRAHSPFCLNTPYIKSISHQEQQANTQYICCIKITTMVKEQTAILTTQQVAARFNELAQQEKWFEIQAEFFAE